MPPDVVMIVGKLCKLCAFGGGGGGFCVWVCVGPVLESGAGIQFSSLSPCNKNL